MHRDEFDAALQPHLRRMIAEDYLAIAAAQVEEEAARLDEKGALLADIGLRRACPICRDDGDQPPLLRKAGMEIVRCRRCPMVYSRFVFTDAAEREFYGNTRFQSRYLLLKHNPGYAELEARKSRYILERLAKYVAPPGRFLDIGCGSGRLLETAQQTGWSALGMEPNPSFAADCRKRSLSVICGWFPEALQPDTATFDAIALLDVLEHVREPVALLAAVRSRLSPRGITAVQVPNFDSLLLRLEGDRSPVICHGHWNYFTAQSLERCASAAGLCMLHVETIISEVDRIRSFPRERIAEVVRAFRPAASLPETLVADWVHSEGMGHKILACLAAA